MRVEGATEWRVESMDRALMGVGGPVVQTEASAWLVRGDALAEV